MIQNKIQHFVLFIQIPNYFLTISTNPTLEFVLIDLCYTWMPKGT